MWKLLYKIPTKFLIGISLLVLFGLIGNTAMAYTVTGSKWSSANPRYIVDSAFSNQNAGWRNSAENAVTGWNNVTNTPLRFTSVGGSGDNHLNVGSYSCSNPKVLAMTNVLALFGPITQFTLRINTACGIPFYDGTQAATIPSNYYDLTTVVRHELGHAIGICHSITKGNLMKPALGTGVVLPLDPDAKNGDRYIYSSTYTGVGPEGGCSQ